jgi:hypothetical protein
MAAERLLSLFRGVLMKTLLTLVIMVFISLSNVYAYVAGKVKSVDIDTQNITIEDFASKTQRIFIVPEREMLNGIKAGDLVNVHVWEHIDNAAVYIQKVDDSMRRSI